MRGNALVRVLAMLALNFSVLALSLEVGTRIFLSDVFYPRPPLYQYDPVLLYRLRSSISELYVAPDFQMRITTDSNGFRTHGTAMERIPRKCVLAMGDSFTMGWGVDNDETWPYFLEQYIQSNLDEDTDVINTGVNGYGTWQYRRISDMSLRTGCTQVVALVIMLVANDPDDNVRFSELENRGATVVSEMIYTTVLGAEDMQPFSNMKRLVQQHSYAYWLLSRKGFLGSLRKALRIRSRGEDLSVAIQDPCALQECAVPPDEVVEDIAYIAGLAEEELFPVFVTSAIHGFIKDELENVCPAYDSDRPTKSNCRFIDITGELSVANNWPPEMVNQHSAAHFSPYGNKLIGEYIGKMMLESIAHASK